MKKRFSKRRLFLKILVVLTVLSSILVSSLLGVSKAEYFKSISKKLDLEIKPDLMLEYYLYDSTTTTSTAASDLTGEKGVYQNAESFSQKIVIGRHAVQTLQNTAGSTNTGSVYYGKDIVYQIKIPVDKTGYYTLNFTSEFIKGDAPTSRDTYMEQDFYSVSYRDAVGCEVLNSENTNSYQDLSFGTPKALDLASRVFDDKVFAEMAGYTADMAFQWKTLTPGRQENVKLSFKVNEDDVKNGYVIWAWELTGLRGNQEFTFVCESLDVEKIMELDGSMVQRESDAPYFMLPKTAVTNAQIRILGKNSPGDTAGAPTTGNNARRGSNTPGKTDYSNGRGTYVTEATANSLGLRVETLSSGVLVSDSGTTWYYDNPTSFQVPLKNIKYNTTYKVTFDFSLAKQGNASPSKVDTSNKIGTAAKNMWDYADYDEILNRNNVPPQHNANATSSTNDNNNTYFFSYLHDNIASLDNKQDVQTIGNHKFNATRITGLEHVTGSTKISYNYKEYNEPLTKYGGIMDYTRVSTNNNYLNMVSSITVNDTYSIESFNSGTEYNSTDMRNHFNAIQHTEINGQVAINWLTFYNTTFSFNIPAGSGVDLNNLNWVWAIDMLEYESFYNIRVDNIRIQEVVEYSSKIEHNGVKVADTVTAVGVDANYYGQERNNPDESVFNNFKGYNNIGQNYQARRNESSRYYAVGNIYAPIFDAKKLSPTASKNGNREDDYKIKISGWAVLKGGTLKYVFSVDGGFTWHDMTFEGTTDASVFPEALQGIHQNTQEQSYDHYSGITHNFTFEPEDAINDRFSDFSLTADLKNFKTQSDLDIIIAAVPQTNPDLRCEILRIINYNPANTYVSKLDSITSDIQGGGGSISVDNSKMSLHNGTSGTSETATAHYYPVYEKGAFDYRFSASGLKSAKGQMAKTEKIYYSNLPTTYSGIPIKTTLTVKGAILCNQSVYAYEYSVDGGKTWKPCTYTMTGFTAGSDYTSGKTETVLDKLLYKFITRSTAKENRSNYMGVGGKFNTDASAIKVDLSAYVGQTVDVIIAAKPNYTYNYMGRYSSDKRESDIYLPVAKIDNVAVYGASGTFYTHINSLTIDGKTIEPTYFDVDDKPLNRVTTGGTVAPQWNLGYTATDGKEFSYTIFEPNNVNAINSRLYNNKINEVQSGSQIVIKGYTAIGGAVHDNEYMYTLDGGDTWNKIHLKNNVEPTDTVKAYAKLSDSSIANFNFANYYDDSTGNLTFAIPALPDGAVRNLTVVAKNAEGNTVPVLNIKLKIKNENVGYYLFNGNTSEGSKNGYYSNNGLITQYFTTYNYSRDMRYKMTFPVSREGVHTLTFNSQINVNPVTTNNDNYKVGGHIVYGWTNPTTSDPYYPGWEFGTGTASMSIPKTNYTVGETLKVSYNWNVTNSKSSPESAIREPWIGIVKVKDDGTFEHINPENLDLNKAGTAGDPYVYPPYVKPINKTSHDATNYSGTVEIPNLPAGEYKVVFANYWNVSRWVQNLKSAPDNGKNAEFHYLGEPINITVKDKFTVTATIVHDDVEQKGGERYYASASASIWNTSDNTLYNPDSVATKEIDNPFEASDVELYFNAIADDVRRGYVVLDWDLSQLVKNSSYTLTIKNLMYSYGVKLTKHLTTDKDGNVSDTISIKVPALDVGTHEFAFSSYTSAYSPVIHQGLDQSDKKVDGNNGSNYKSAGAYMSVPKTVYNVGEPIHVSYSMAGAQTDYGQWIGISRAIDGRDAVIAYDYVHDNGVTEGIVTLKPGISKCEVGAEEFANLPAGDYKIYFRDFDSNVYRGSAGTNDNKGRYWPECNITDPIAITIIDPNRKNDNPYKQTYYFDDVNYTINKISSGVSGYISLDKTVFRVGEDITFNYHKSEAFGNPVGEKTIYIGFAEPNYTGASFIDTDGVYFGNLEDGKIDIPDNIAPGRYQLYCCDYGLADARKYGSVIAVIDIVILPADGENSPTMDLTYAHQSGNSALDYNYTSISAYDYSRNPISIDVTEADVDRGYVEFKYELNNLVPNEDIVYTTEMFYNRKIEDEPYIKDGNYIYFGEYPQTLKLSSVEILENVAPDYRGYYKGSDGYYYAKVVANPYGDDYIFANGNNYVVEGRTYYFKVEPIKWRILKTSNGYYDLLCESIIDNRAYDNDSNKYDVSDVRKWLNETFYKTAFSDFQKEYILQTTVDNSLASTGYAENNYTCEDTYDKVYLPSYADVTKNEYGFSDDGYEIDLNRIKTVTDYARATGAWINMSEWDGNMGSGIWMLRSPADSSSIFIREGYYIGDVTDGGINVKSNAHGVVPMIRLATSLGETYDIKYSTSSNFAVEHQAFSYVPTSGGTATTNYPDSKLSLPSMYFEYGKPIEVSYKVPSNSRYRVVVTKETRNNGKKDANGKIPDGAVLDDKIINATVCIKSTDLYSTEGTVNLNQVKAHNSPLFARRLYLFRQSSCWNL